MNIVLCIGDVVVCHLFLVVILYDSTIENNVVQIEICFILKNKYIHNCLSPQKNPERPTVLDGRHRSSDKWLITITQQISFISDRLGDLQNFAQRKLWGLCVTRIVYITKSEPFIYNTKFRSARLHIMIFMTSYNRHITLQ